MAGVPVIVGARFCGGVGVGGTGSGAGAGGVGAGGVTTGGVGVGVGAGGDTGGCGTGGVTTGGVGSGTGAGGCGVGVDAAAAGATDKLSRFWLVATSSIHALSSVVVTTNNSKFLDFAMVPRPGVLGERSNIGQLCRTKVDGG